MARKIVDFDVGSLGLRLHRTFDALEDTGRIPVALALTPRAFANEPASPDHSPKRAMLVQVIGFAGVSVK